MEIVKRALIMFGVLFIIIKILGKKQIKNLTLYDYILSITIGSIAADTIISTDVPLIYGIIALGVFGIIGYVSSILAYYNHNVEEIVDGTPIVLYENDNFNYDNLEMTKFSVAKVLESCRLKGCFDINELGWVVLEPSGDVSVLLKENYQTVVNNDLKGTVRKNSLKQSLNRMIIVDGVVNEEELMKVNKGVSWLKKYLKEQKVSLENVGLLTIDANDKITMLRKK